MKINHNIPALLATANAGKAGMKANSAMQNLSSGVRINRASDNPTGLAITNKLRNQANGLNVANQNSLDGISLIQTAEGALGEMHNIVQRMRELAIQASSDSITTSDRRKIQVEADGLRQEIVDMTKRTEFNNIKIFGGDLDIYEIDPTTGQYKMNAGDKIEKYEGFSLQIGPNKNMEMKMNIPNVLSLFSSLDINLEVDKKQSMPDLDEEGEVIWESVGTETRTYVLDFCKPFDFDDPNDNNINYMTRESAETSIVLCDKVISTISALRSELGSNQNRLEYTISGLDTAATNTIQSLSRIEDTDMAKEMTEFSSFSVIQQAGFSILAQANQRPQMILELMR